MKDIPAALRVVTKLEEERCQQATDMALGDVLEIKVIIGNQGRPVFSHVPDILDNGGADRRDEVLLWKYAKSHIPKNAFPNTRCGVSEGINKHKCITGRSCIRLP
jgi:hypothetical protein